MLVDRNQTAVSHPLDPLSASEINQIVALLRQHPGVAANICFHSMQAIEPDKVELAAYEVEKRPFPRRAFVILLDKQTSHTYEAIVNLNCNQVEGISHIPGVKPGVLLEEMEEAEAVIKANPEFQAALRRRGITDFERVSVDPWAPGYYGDPLEDKHRLSRGVPYLNEQIGDNFYARPIENLLVLIDINKMEVVRVDDFDPVPVPQESADFLTGLPSRSDVKPLEITQPEGVSFTVEGWQIRWQKWQMRISFNHREGLVLHQVGYEDNGRLRPILHRISLAEMTVPYGDPGLSQYRKNAFDAGEYGLGMLTNSLELGCDCLGEIYYFDADLVTINGQVRTIKNAICLHEEDASLLWKHVDVRAKGVAVRRSRRLVVSFIATVGNYEYGFYWCFYQDGNIQLDVRLTGILQTGAYVEGDAPRFGSRLNGRLYAPNHQHFFCVRLHTAVDGSHNTVVETDTLAAPADESNPYGNAFYAQTTPLRHEQAAQRLIDPFAARTWSITNPNSLNKVGQPVAYKLIPGENSLPFAQPSAYISQRAGYMFKHLWVTPYHPNEKYPGGAYPYQSPGGDGLPQWAAQDRSVDNEDIVVWYVMGHTHVPRLEDWPVMPVATIGFWLKPSGFFAQSPAMDVPASLPHHCHMPEP